MKRDYEYHDINEMGAPCMFIDKIARPRFQNQINSVKNVNKTLLENFNKIAIWISENHPKLNGVFKCRHNPYYWIALKVEDGKAYLENGSHGYGFSNAMSLTETAIFSRGSMQSKAYAFNGYQFAGNSILEEFLSQWQEIKQEIIHKSNIQNNVYSKDFVV